MADSTVTVKGGPSALGRAMVKTLQNVQKAMAQAAVTTARWGVARMVQVTAAQKVDATGQFKRQWKVVRFPGGAATANTSPYASSVEAGRGAGRMPPVDAIEKWILAKGIRPRKPPTVGRAEALRATSKSRRITGDVTGGKQRKRLRANIKLYAKIYRSKPARTLRHANMIAGLALGIARKIGKKGTKPKWLLREALDEFQREAAKNYDAALRRVARDPLGRVRRTA